MVTALVHLQELADAEELVAVGGSGGGASGSGRGAGRTGAVVPESNLVHVESTMLAVGDRARQCQAYSVSADHGLDDEGPTPLGRQLAAKGVAVGLAGQRGSQQLYLMAGLEGRGSAGAVSVTLLALLGIGQVLKSSQVT